jgi:UDP-2,3-diacylglucosamine pyrophosphatase LpxH
MIDFTKANYTAIISDLHLCEAEPVNIDVLLWKKYKTREFFFDDTFADFLQFIGQRSDGEPVELVLNGDIFDFDSVVTLPLSPPYRVSWLEKLRGLYAEEEKSLFKIKKIIEDHTVWFSSLSQFLRAGNRVVFVIGNHDLELHWQLVQTAIIEALNLSQESRSRLRFCEWFYISNGDTLIEHGNQYDPYCLCNDPVHPFVRKYNKIAIKLPFGNIASRYMINGMGFFNPHVDSAYIMTLSEYLRFFVKYILRAQPLLIWTWFWGATMTLLHSFADTLRPSLRDPLRIEDRTNRIAHKANATPRMVRELKELFADPATLRPLIVARELWLDRAFILLLGFLVLFETFLFIKQVYEIRVFWMFVPILLLVPFFLFYSRSIYSKVHQYKEPQEDLLATSAVITHTKRIVYGHTHIVRHEIIGAVEHLNPGSWSPAFLDVECTKPIGQKSFIWLRPSEGAPEREAKLLQFKAGGATQAFGLKRKRLSLSHD